MYIPIFDRSSPRASGRAVQRVSGKRERKKIERCPPQRKARRRTRVEARGTRTRVSLLKYSCYVGYLRRRRRRRQHRRRTYIHIRTCTHTQQAASFSTFFSSPCIAPFPVSMHRSRRREPFSLPLSLSLARCESFVFEMYEPPIQIHACSIHVHAYMPLCARMHTHR